MGGSYVVSGVFGLVVAGVAWLEARTFPLQDLQEGMGAAFMPWLILGLIVVLSISSIGYGLVRGINLQKTFHPGPKYATVGGLFLVLCGFVVAFAFIGLLIPVIVFLIVGMRLLGAPWAKAVGIGLVAGVCTYALFVIGFSVPMP